SGETPSGSPSGLRHLKLPAPGNPSSYLIDNLAQGDTHRHFNEAFAVDVPCHGKDLSARTPRCAESSEPVGPVKYYRRDIGQCFYVIHHSRLSEETMGAWIRGLDPRLSSAAFHRLNKGSLLTAHVGACTSSY